jgi:hypothetical protein
MRIHAARFHNLIWNDWKSFSIFQPNFDEAYISMKSKSISFHIAGLSSRKRKTIMQETAMRSEVIAGRREYIGYSIIWQARKRFEWTLFVINA